MATGKHEAATARFESLGIPLPSEDSVRVATEEVSRLENALFTQNAGRDELMGARGVQEAACRNAENRTKAAEEKLASERREAEPAVARWERLRDQATKFKLVESLSPALPGELREVRGQVNLVHAAQTQRAILLERPQSAQRGCDVTD